MKQIGIGVIAVLSSLLASDARAETDTVQGPDGRPIHQTSCQWDNTDCYKEARATCRGNYQVLDSHSSAGGIFADQIAGPIKWFHMTYACGATNGAIARFPQQGGTWQAPRPLYLECGGNRWGASCGGFN